MPCPRTPAALSPSLIQERWSSSRWTSTGYEGGAGQRHAERPLRGLCAGLPVKVRSLVQGEEWALFGPLLLPPGALLLAETRLLLLMRFPSVLLEGRSDYCLPFIYLYIF